MLRSRFVHAVDFRYEGGRWVIPSETAAAFPIAVALLEPTTAHVLHEEWMP